MKKEIIRYTICAAVILLLTLPGSLFLKNAKENLYRWRIDMAEVPGITYRTYVRDLGWQEWVKDGEISGTVNQARSIDAIEIKVEDSSDSGGVKYRTFVEAMGWQDWCKDGEASGTIGQSLRIEAAEIELTGELAKNYNVYYRMNVQDQGWMGWTGNGEAAGASGISKQAEIIQIVITPKSMKIPPKSFSSVTENEIRPYISQ